MTKFSHFWKFPEFQIVFLPKYSEEHFQKSVQQAASNIYLFMLTYVVLMIWPRFKEYQKYYTMLHKQL